MRFCLDQFGERVFIDDAEQGDTYFCPECGEKMVQRRGEIRAHHFAHYPNTQCTDVWRYDESDWHTKYQNLFPKENQEIVKEFNGKKHRADILFEDRKTVIEIQGDRLREDEFEQRNKFFNALGYKVIWLFDESRVFENESINYGYRRMACSRAWLRPSRTFRNFSPQSQIGEIEVWFQRSESDFDDQPRFFQVLASYDHLKRMECGFCHSLKELMKYLKEGKRTPDYSGLYDIKYGIKRTDGTKSICYCPKRPSESFLPQGTCEECPFKVHVDYYNGPYQIGCSYRFEHMKWDYNGEISDFQRRGDGLIESVTLSTADGEAEFVRMDCPKTFLRSLMDLWNKYRPLKFIIAYNTMDQRTYSVFNPGWQKAVKGVVKGKFVNARGFAMRGETEIPQPEEPVWIAVDVVKPEQNYE